MKKIETERKRFLIENGYAEGIDVVSSYVYRDLPDSIKSQYKEGADGKFYKEAEFPNIPDGDLREIIDLEHDRKLRRMEEYLKVIKYCAVILAITTIISVISGIVSYCSYQSAIKDFTDIFKVENDTDYDYYNF